MRTPPGMPTERIVDVFRYRCRLQLAELSTQILERVWVEDEAVQFSEVQRMRAIERQALRRAYQRMRHDSNRVADLFSLSMKRAYTRLALEVAGLLGLLYVAWLVTPT